MGDGHDGPRVVLQGPLEPGHRLGVEVVGGLVEQEQVGLGEQEPAQRDATAFATRQGGDVGVGRRESKRVHGDLQGALEVPRPQGVDAGLQARLLGQEGVEVGVGVGEAGADLVEAHQQVALLAHAVGDVAHHVLALVELGLLGQVAHRESGRQAGFAGETVVEAGHDAQQR